MKKNQTSKLGFSNITIGIQLGFTVFIFVFIGHKLDQKFNSSPWFLLGGVVLGMGIGFYHLFKGLNSLTEKDQQEQKDSNKNTKVKWK